MWTLWRGPAQSPPKTPALMYEEERFDMSIVLAKVVLTWVVIVMTMALVSYFNYLYPPSPPPVLANTRNGTTARRCAPSPARPPDAGRELATGPVPASSHSHAAEQPDTMTPVSGPAPEPSARARARAPQDVETPQSPSRPEPIPNITVVPTIQPRVEGTNEAIGPLDPDTTSTGVVGDTVETIVKEPEINSLPPLEILVVQPVKVSALQADSRTANSASQPTSSLRSLAKTPAVSSPATGQHSQASSSQAGPSSDAASSIPAEKGPRRDAIEKTHTKSGTGPLRLLNFGALLAPVYRIIA